MKTTVCIFLFVLVQKEMDFFFEDFFFWDTGYWKMIKFKLFDELVSHWQYNVYIMKLVNPMCVCVWGVLCVRKLIQYHMMDSLNFGDSLQHRITDTTRQRSLPLGSQLRTMSYSSLTSRMASVPPCCAQ